MKTIKIEIPFEKFEGLVKASLISDFKVLEIKTMPILDEHGERLKTASIKAYKDYNEYLHKLKENQNILD